MPQGGRCRAESKRSEDRTDRAAQEAARVEFDFRQPQRSGDQVAVLQGVTKTCGRRVVRRSRPDDSTRRALVGHGAERIGKTTLLKMVPARSRRTRRGEARRQPQARVAGAAGAQVLDPDLPSGIKWAGLPHESTGVLRNLPGVSVLGRRDQENPLCRVGRRGWCRACCSIRPISSCSTTDQPSRSSTKDMLIDRSHNSGTMLFVRVIVSPRAQQPRAGARRRIRQERKPDIAPGAHVVKWAGGEVAGASGGRGRLGVGGQGSGRDRDRGENSRRRALPQISRATDPSLRIRTWTPDPDSVSASIY